MKIERTHDMAAVREILNHPAIFPYIHEDGIEEANPIDHEGLHWLLVSDDAPAGVFLAHAHNASCYEVHTSLLPRIWGSGAKHAAKLAQHALFREIGCKKIITNVPAYNRRALLFAKRCGMTIEGVNRASYLYGGNLIDQIILGITEKEWELCQQ
jgi:RimJ/RimL family protein N-acetyltransferase